MVYTKASECEKEGGGVVPPICAVSLDEIVRFVSGWERGEELNKYLETLLNIFSKRGVEVLDDLVKERLQAQGCAQSLRMVHLSASRSGFGVREYTPCLKEYIEERNFIPDRP